MTLDLTRDRLVVRLKGGPVPASDARAVAEDVLRAGEYAFDPVAKLPLIAMADFPALP